LKIYTGYFARVNQYRQAGLVTISIARFNKYYSGASLKLLAPTAEMIKEPEKTYIPKYYSILSKLSKEGILKEIERLSEGKDCILLCYEKPTDFCHRQIVAKWLGIACSGEYDYAPRTPVKEIQKQIF
jgi:uncharacterized protein (DUF488 family)